MEAKNNTSQCICKMETHRYRKQTDDYQGDRIWEYKLETWD